MIAILLVVDVALQGRLSVFHKDLDYQRFEVLLFPSLFALRGGLPPRGKPPYLSPAHYHCSNLLLHLIGFIHVQTFMP